MVHGPELAGVFLGALPEQRRAAFAGLRGLPALLDDAVRMARAAWPTISLAADAFVRHLAERVPEDAAAERALADMLVEPLFLACACATGDSVAIAAFEVAHKPAAEQALQRMKVGDAFASDVWQILLHRLFVGTSGRPKILEYRGRGDLGRWLRVVAIREAGAILGKERRETPADSAVLEAAVVQEGDFDVSLLRREFADAFRVAIENAFSGLDPQLRNMLRMSIVERLSAERIAHALGVHRTTAQRQLEKARATLVADTRKSLRAQLKLDPWELESLMRVVRSQVEVSLAGFLAADRTSAG